MSYKITFQNRPNGIVKPLISQSTKMERQSQKIYSLFVVESIRGSSSKGGTKSINYFNQGTNQLLL